MAARNNTDTHQGAPSRLLGSGPRRWRWVGMGAGLMAVGALGSAYAVELADQREGVLVAAADLPAGHTLTSEDVNVVAVAGAEELALLSRGDMQQAVGQTLTVPVWEGTPLAEGTLVESGDYPTAGQAVVGAVLEPTQYPASLRPGAHVSVIAAESAHGSEEAASEPEAAWTPVRAQVQALLPTEGEGAALVELLVEATDAGDVAQAAAAGELALVRIPPDGGS